MMIRLKWHSKDFCCNSWTFANCKLIDWCQCNVHLFHNLTFHIVKLEVSINLKIFIHPISVFAAFEEDQ